MEDTVLKKGELRDYFRKIRGEIAQENRQAADELLIEKTLGLREYKEAKILLAYYPVKGEPNILRLIEHALDEGKKVAFPICHKDNTMTFHFVCTFSELTPSSFSIPEPDEFNEMFLCDGTENALCIVPGLAFDREGYRIGYGKGFYDRFLQGFVGKTIGLVYSELLCDSLPREDTDRAVDIIITPKEEIYTC